MGIGKVRRLTWGLITLGSIILILSVWWKHRPKPLILWTMIHVNESIQGDAHLLEFESGENFLIDVGYWGAALSKFLREKNIHTIDKVIISHAHKDHYGGLALLMKEGIQIKQVYFNQPHQEVCDREMPWGCDWNHIENWKKLIQSRNIPISPMEKGDVLLETNNTKLEVLYAFDGLNTPVGKTGINDTSVLLKLTTKKHSALFTGDLNWPIGGYLAKSGKGLKADILKVPHHGTGSIAPPEFFDRVAPSLALVPSPKYLWFSHRSAPIKKYFETNKIPTYVNGLHGHVTVEFFEKETKVTWSKTNNKVTLNSPALSSL